MLLLAFITIATAWPPFAPVAAAAPPTGEFVLTRAKVGGGATNSGLATIFTGFEIGGSPAGNGIALAAHKTFPVESGVEGAKSSSATGTFSLDATVDPATGRAAGTFTYVQTSAATWDVTQEYRGVKTVIGSGEMKAKATWKGDVAGSVDADTAELTFSGTFVADCSMVVLGVTKDCSSRNTYVVPVTYSVAGPSATAMPSAPATDPVGFTQDVSGDVYISPASEANLEPAARRFVVVKPGERLALEAGALLRTGRDGTVTIIHATGARTRLSPSTLFGLKQFGSDGPSQWAVYGRLFEGIASFYMQNWKESGKKFEVETDRANTSITGTTYEIAVTEAATVVSVSEGVVEVTDNATGTALDVGPGERATVDAAGMRKTTISPSPSPSASPAASGPDPTTASTPAATAGPTLATLAAGPITTAPATQTAAAPPNPAPAATASPAASGTGSGGNDPPIGILVAIVAGIVFVSLVAVGWRRRTPRT